MQDDCAEGSAQPLALFGRRADGNRGRQRSGKEKVVADLDADDREKIPTKEFGLPEKARTKDAKKQSGNYPMPDKAHARNAKSRAAQAQKAGNLSKKDQERIDRKADRILDK